MPLFNISQAIGNQFIQLLDARSSGTPASNAASGWNDRAINQVKHDDTGLVGINSNQFILPAGTYYLSANVSFYRSYETRLRLFNHTNSEIILLGLNSYVGNIDCGLTAPLEGIFNIGSSQSLSIQYNVGNASSSLGVGVNAGVDEVYLVANLWKIEN